MELEFSRGFMLHNSKVLPTNFLIDVKYFIIK